MPKFNIKMLSILIPTYNYNVLPLVSLLHQQCEENTIVYEIIVLDDGSGSVLNNDNQKINSLVNCRFKVSEKNIGRSAIRNLLAKTAQYDWLLFLDADTLPIDNTFISKYLPCIDNQLKVVYGGIEYQKKRPEKKNLLRWVYGNSREVVTAAKRCKKPYVSLLTLNFLIKKQVFNIISFNESIPNLRHEDTLFSYNLSQAKIKIEHCSNPVYHLGLESSEIFIRKEEQSAEILKYLIDHNLISKNYVRVSKMQHLIKKLGINALVVLGFKIVKKTFTKNLKGNHPSIFIFDLYRLGYLCSLK